MRTINRLDIPCLLLYGAQGLVVSCSPMTYHSESTVLKPPDCSLGAAIAGAIDYKIMMSKNYEDEQAEDQAWSECHTRSAKRVLKALLANGGMDVQETSSFFLAFSDIPV